jgi:hypothetical protein
VVASPVVVLATPGPLRGRALKLSVMPAGLPGAP